MGKVHACAPVYLSGAAVFLTIGGALVYFRHEIIGAIFMVPGIILLVLALLTALILFEARRSDEVRLVIMDSDTSKETRNSRKAHASRKKRKRKNRK